MFLFKKFYALEPHLVEKDEPTYIKPYEIPNREEQFNKLDQEFDVVIFGGTLQSSAIALDAISRNLKVALIINEEYIGRGNQLIGESTKYFSSYLKNIFNFKLFQNFKNDLKERNNIYKLCPHLFIGRKISIPNYSSFEFYKNMEKKKEYLISTNYYYEAQTNEIRLNTSLLMTCISLGVVTLNHQKIEEFIEDERLKEVLIKDKDDNIIRKIKGKYFINSTSFLEMDRIRNLSKFKKHKLKEEKLIKFILPFNYSNYNTILKKDNILLIPFERNTLLSFESITPKDETQTQTQTHTQNQNQTQNQNHTHTHTQTIINSLDDQNIKPNENDIKYYLNQFKNEFNIPIDRIDVLSCWFEINKNEFILKDENNLMNVSNQSISKLFSISNNILNEIKNDTNSGVLSKILYGSQNFNHFIFTELKLKYNFLDIETIRYLKRNYGDRSNEIVNIMLNENKKEKISNHFPQLEAELLYSIRNEYTRNIIDFMDYRTNMMKLNGFESLNCIEKIANIMMKELNWSKSKKLKEIENTKLYILKHYEF
eukprot:gene9876-2198_t